MADPAGLSPHAANDPVLRDLMARIPRRISDLVDARAAERPDGLAYKSPFAGLSWAEMVRAVDDTAALFKDNGVRPGDRVVVPTENSLAGVVALFALARLDAWASLVNARMSAAEIDQARQVADARLVVFAASESPAATAHADAAQATLIDAPSVGRYGFAHYNPNAETEPVKESAAEQVGALMFTSGTTGQPKAVMISHQAIAYTGATQCLSRRVTPADRFWIVSPISHAIGLSSSLMSVAWSGAPGLMSPRFDPTALAKAIVGGEISILIGVPQMFAKLLDVGEQAGYPFGPGQLRVAGTGGAPVDATLKRRMEETFGIAFGNAYGCSEMTPITRVADGSPVAGEAVGVAQPGIEVKLVREDGQPGAVGEVGEIWARGPCRMLGYFRNPEATAQAIKPGGWLATGDLGTVDENGVYSVVGRIKELIIRSGFNVYPPELEAMINAYPGVASSAVVGRKVPGNEEIVAYVQPGPGASVTADDLRTYLRDNLAAYKVPQVIEIADLPIGPTGKILKSALAKRAAEAVAAA